MKLYPVMAGYFRCDGGALFGVVPKVMWQKHYPANDDNLCDAAMRCLLVVDGERKILIDAGAGDKYDARYARNSGIHGDLSLPQSLEELGIAPAEITDVVLTHLHWDHVGGAVVFDSDGVTPTLLFPNATHWVTESQWHQAWNPNIRDRNAYFKQDLTCLSDSGKLKFVTGEGMFIPNIEGRIFNGHTPGQLIPIVHYGGRKVVFTGDLIPVAANIPIGWLASYDLFPVETMNEKMEFLQEVVDQKMVLFFEHDRYQECATLEAGVRGPQVNQFMTLAGLPV